MDYVIDLLKKLTRKQKIGAFIFLIANLALILWVCMNMADEPLYGLMFGLTIYLGGAYIALSPIGEWILRKKLHAKEFDDEADKIRVNTITSEVYAKGVKLESALPNDIKFYVIENDDMNAFATGRKTICICRGLLNLDDEVIKGVLAHEFGHLANKDTDITLLNILGNFPILVAFFIADLIITFSWEFTKAAGRSFSSSRSTDDDNFLIGILFGLGGLVITVHLWIFFKLPMIIWEWLYRLCLLHSGRQDELSADKFACNLGYGEGLVRLFNALEQCTGEEERNKGFFEKLLSTHPNTSLRIEHIKSIIG